MGDFPAKAASDYFNSLPIEQRRRLAPLLEDYRRRGIAEALAEVRSVGNKLASRERSIRQTLDLVPLDNTVPALDAKGERHG